MGKYWVKSLAFVGYNSDKESLGKCYLKQLPVPVAPFSYAIKVKGRDFLFVPNQIPIDSSGEIVGKGDVIAQATWGFENLRAILDKLNFSFENVVKMTWYLTTRKNWAPVVQVRERYFKDKWPAATFVLVDTLSREDVLFEMNAIVFIN